MEPFDREVARLETFLAQGRAGEMEYLGTRGATGELLRADPRLLFAEAKCAVVVALPYSLQSSAPSADPLRGRIAAYAQYADYHLVLREMLLDLADGICTLAQQPLHSRVCVDSAPVLERDLAVRAGLSFLGKNTLAISPGAGSAFLLGELFLDLPLPTTTAALSGCGSCTACLSACPTQAFRGPFELEPRRCISYLTIEARADIPRELRPQIGRYVFGCDECQTICPYNQSPKLLGAPARFNPLQRLNAPSLIALLELSTGDYKRFVRGSALRRVPRDQLARNAAVALGNSGDEHAVDPLFRIASGTRSASLRSHAAWALGHLGYAFDLALARQKLLLLQTDPEQLVADEARRWSDEPA